MSTEKKKFTIMVVPHSEAKIYSYRIASWALALLAVAWLGSICAASFIITRHANYELTRRANISLAEKNAYFVKEIARTHEAFQRVAKMEEELKAMLKMKDEKTLIKYSGEGGPTMADQAQLMTTLSNRATLTTSEFTASLGYLKKNATQRMETYTELKKYIATQRSLMASKPTAWPVRGWVTSRFGNRHSPFFEGITFHNGLDIANEEGTSIKAPADGVVTFAGWQGSYGKLIVIDHGYGFSSRYGHLHRLLVNSGQRVRRGQVMAFMGTTGRSSAPHLHYEIRVNGVPVDPFKYLGK